MKRASIFLLFILMKNICAGADTIIVHKDDRLNIFTEKQAYVNKVTSKINRSGLTKGFRLQVLSTRSREEAFKTKATLLQNFPDQKAYVLFQSPYFKVRVGNFLTKSEANDFKDLVGSLYSQNVYVIQDMIEYIPGPDDDFLNQ